MDHSDSIKADIIESEGFGTIDEPFFDYFEYEITSDEIPEYYIYNYTPFIFKCQFPYSLISWPEYLDIIYDRANKLYYCDDQCLEVTGPLEFVVEYTEINVGTTYQFEFVWHVVSGCVLKFDGNGGSDVPSSIKFDGDEYDYGCTITVPSQEPMRPGCNFNSWNTARDGSGTTYHAGDSINVRGNYITTLYAIWEQNTSKLTFTSSPVSDCTIEYIGLSRTS